MVGNDVEQQSESQSFELRGKAREPLIAAQLRIQPVMAGNVVPMHTAGPGFKDGRGIEIPDAQFFEVGQDRKRLGK